MAFQKATKEQAKARIALCGPGGSGKTYTALSWARVLGQRVAVIDTERKSASKYADLFEFDTDDLETFSPAKYVEKIREAEKAGYDVIVIDSLSHAWAGKGGALEMADNAAARGGNKFAAWRDVTPQHNSLVDAILSVNAHVIATMRVKSEYVVETNERGKSVPRKVGLAPVQRDGMEYEFDIVGDMDIDHRLIVTKSRCLSLADAVIVRPGQDVAEKIRAWLTDGVTPAPRVERAPEPPAEDEVAVLIESWVEMLNGFKSEDEVSAWAKDTSDARKALSATSRQKLTRAYNQTIARLNEAKKEATA